MLHVFSDDHLGLNNSSWYLTLGKTDCPPFSSHSFHSLTITLYVGWGLVRFLPSTLGAVIQYGCEKSHKSPS